MLKQDQALNYSDVQLFLPQIQGLFAELAGRNVFIFLDDFHVLDLAAQPKLLGLLYALTRGKNVFLKISAIETLTKSWDPEGHVGLEVPHDAQTIKLDYNLTMPDRAAQHIESILDAHAVYCGLPSVRFLCTSSEVLPRLTWVSAGVPRDALNMFAQAMTRGLSEGRSKVSVMNVNMATSEMVGQKMRELEIDVPKARQDSDLKSTLDHVRGFCMQQMKKNAFLVEIGDSQFYHQLLGAC